MEFQSRIEEELRCPQCSQLYVDAVLLSCSHSICLQCAVCLARDCSQVFGGKSSTNQPRCDSLAVPGSSPVPVDDASPAGGGTSKAAGDSDRSSVGSETDSGVICTGTTRSTTPSTAATSRPNSFVGADNNGTPSVGNLSTTSSQDSGSSGSSAQAQINCPRCRRPTNVEDSSVAGITGFLPRNRCLEAVVDRYRSSRQIPILCQRCGKDGGEEKEDVEKVESTTCDGKRAAVGLCEQCLMFLCDRCVDAGRHGPGCVAGDHGPSLLSPASHGKSWLSARSRSNAVGCVEHGDETMSLYCVQCSMTVCRLCQAESRHSSHDIKPLSTISRSHKVTTSFSIIIFRQRYLIQGKKTVLCTRKLEWSLILIFLNKPVV